MPIGFLIVNADDFGYDTATTDAIVESYASKRITSATAMVGMSDSARAARVARAIGLPVGLHLNLSEPFTASTVPKGALRLQADLVPRFDGRQRRWQRWVVDPTIKKKVERCVAYQLDEFAALYGRAPTHVDGHKHVQVSPTVARSPELSRIPLRRALSDVPGSRSPIVVARRVRHRLVLSRAPGTDYVFSITRMGTDLLAGREPPLLGLAHHEVMEVIAHPGLPAERALLMTDAWAEALRHARLGTYGNLR